MGNTKTENSTSSDGPTVQPIKFSNCTFVKNSALKAGGAIEIILGRAHVDNSVFVGNIAPEGGALRLFSSIMLLNSSFSDNISGEGGGPAISNIGIISEMIGLSLSGNRFLCSATEFVDVSQASFFLAINRQFPRESPPGG